MSACRACWPRPSRTGSGWSCSTRAPAGDPRSRTPRVRVVIADDVAGVGAAKRRACAEADGEILVELDHDDLLEHATACRGRRGVRRQPRRGLRLQRHRADPVTAAATTRGSTRRTAGSTARRTSTARSVCQSQLAPTPHNVSYIWYAPNHVRAFRRTAYEKVGGYDETSTWLDDQDLMCRLYQVGEFHHVRDASTCSGCTGQHPADRETNALIQQRTVELYDRHVQPNALAWARRQRPAGAGPGRRTQQAGRLPGRRPVSGPGRGHRRRLAAGISICRTTASA